MISNKKDLISVIDAVLTPGGYVRQGLSWYRHCDETVLLIDLQKSDVGGQFLVNLGVSVCALNAERFPSEAHCHLRMRLDRVADNREAVLRAFDLEDTTIGPILRHEAVQLLIDEGARWLERFATAGGVAGALRSDASLRNRATMQVKAYFGLKATE
jgi:hypothetical protein